jgi:carbamoyltransferase
MIIVGISAFYHDAACAVLVDGQLAAAAQEERFTRRRGDPAVPLNSFRACLAQAGVSIADIDYVAYYEDPVLKLGRQLWMRLPEIPLASPATMFRFDADRPYREIRERLGYDGPVITVKHHEAHAASAFYFSGFPESAILTADAVGEWATMSYGRGGPDGIELFEEVSFPHSIGLFYSTLTSYLGFEVNSDEGKVMGLAPYGRPRYAESLRNLIKDLPGGQFRLNLDYFDFCGGDRMYTAQLKELIGLPPRLPDDPIETPHEDLAASLQSITEEILLAKAGHLHKATGSDFMSYAGGVALNCCVNTRIRSEGPFRDLFVQPAAGDAGGSVGAAVLAHHRLTGTFTRQRLADARLGPAFDTHDLEQCLRQGGVQFSSFAGRVEALLGTVAQLLADGKVVGWFQGRMEFGPRALGARSILADPRSGTMRDHVNAIVKKREAFRPFAPAVTAERCAEFFELDRPSPFMLETVQVRPGANLPAITHVDGSARIQTVDREVDPRFHGLLTQFGKITGYPILLNTSFNMRGEPIVCSPADALLCFVMSRLDVLVIDELMLLREHMPQRWEGLVEAIAPVLERGISSDVYALF